MDNVTLKNLVTSLKETVNSEAFDKDFDKFLNGTASAGTRVRKVLQEVKTLAQDLRVAVQEKKNA